MTTPHPRIELAQLTDDSAATPSELSVSAPQGARPSSVALNSEGGRAKRVCRPARDSTLARLLRREANVPFHQVFDGTLLDPDFMATFMNTWVNPPDVHRRVKNYALPFVMMDARFAWSLYHLVSNRKGMRLRWLASKAHLTPVAGVPRWPAGDVASTDDASPPAPAVRLVPRFEQMYLSLGKFNPSNIDARLLKLVQGLCVHPCCPQIDAAARHCAGLLAFFPHVSSFIMEQVSLRQRVHYKWLIESIRSFRALRDLRLVIKPISATDLITAFLVEILESAPALVSLSVTDTADDETNEFYGEELYEDENDDRIADIDPDIGEESSDEENGDEEGSDEESDEEEESDETRDEESSDEEGGDEESSDEESSDEEEEIDETRDDAFDLSPSGFARRFLAPPAVVVPPFFLTPFLAHLTLELPGLFANFSESDFETMFRMTPQLETLVLTHTLAGQVAGALRLLPNLAVLCLGTCRLGDSEGVKVVQTLASMPRVIQIDLGYNELGCQAAQALAEAFPRLAELRVLCLTKNPLGPTGALVVARSLVHLHRLEHLDMGGVQMGPDSGIALAIALCSLPSVKRVTVERNQLADEASWCFVNWAKDSRRTVHLDLRWNCITRSGTQRIMCLLREIVTPRPEVDVSTHDRDVDANSVSWSQAEEFEGEGSDDEPVEGGILLKL